MKVVRRPRISELRSSAEREFRDHFGGMVAYEPFTFCFDGTPSVRRYTPDFLEFVTGVGGLVEVKWSLEALGHVKDVTTHRKLAYVARHFSCPVYAALRSELYKPRLITCPPSLDPVTVEKVLVHNDDAWEYWASREWQRPELVTDTEAKRVREFLGSMPWKTA